MIDWRILWWSYLKPIVSTATDMCRGWSGHVYKLRSSIGSKSISWKMMQSQSFILSASTKPIFMRAARLKRPSAICSTTKMPYSICCFIKNGWIFFRKIGKWWARSRYGMTMATRSFALHSIGLNVPPGNNLLRKRSSTRSNFSYDVSTSIGPCKSGGIGGQLFRPNEVINFCSNCFAPVPISLFDVIVVVVVDVAIAWNWLRLLFVLLL